MRFAEPISAQLSSSTDRDTFKVNFASNGVLGVTTYLPNINSGNLYWTIGVYNEDGALIAQRVATGTGGDITFSVGVSAGVSYVQVRSSSYHNDAPYSVTLYGYEYSELDQFAWESEPNDEFIQANTITSGSPRSGQLFSSSDQDHYQVELSSDGVLSVDINFSSINSGNQYWRVGVYSSDGSLIAQRSATGIGKNLNLSTGATAGIYYVRVESSSYHYDGTYTIKVWAYEYEGEQVDRWEQEDNNQALDANQIQSGASISGQLSSSADEDYYRIELPNSADLSVEVQLPGIGSGNSYWQIQLLDAEEQLLAQQVVKGTGDTLIISSDDLDAGHYYVLIKSSSYHESAVYSLTPLVRELNIDEGLLNELEVNNRVEDATSIPLNRLVQGQLSTSTMIIMRSQFKALESFRLTFNYPVGWRQIEFSGVHRFITLI